MNIFASTTKPLFGLFTTEGTNLPNGFYFFGMEVRFYAIFILVGALTALFLASYRAHKKGYPWETYDVVFITAFPAGIIGARIWYVIAEWNTKFGPNFSSDPFAMFRTWDGGLAIQGGVIGGILIGVLMVMWRRKGMSVFKAADFAVPTILIAQAIGRWGNFMNGEVYGQFVTTDAWNFLPSFIINNLHTEGGLIGAPLFFVEGLINIGGYFFLTHGIDMLFGKFYEDGDAVCCYFVWYGVVRAVLEPLRNPKYIMGGGESMKSVSMAIAFVVVGLIALVANHVIRYQLRKKKQETIK